MASPHSRFRRLERRFVHTLLAGFSLVLAMMVGSGFLGLQAMKRIDTEAASVSEHYLRETGFLDRLALLQAKLGVLLYELADSQAARGADRLHQECLTLQSQILALTNEALTNTSYERETAAWRALQQASEPLFAEIGRLRARRGNPSPTLPGLYREFTTATARLLDASYDDVSEYRARQARLDAGVLQSSRNLLMIGLALAALCAAASVGVSLALFHRLEKQADRLAQLSLHTLAQQEDAARRFSQEMHDEFGQTLNAIESTLTVVQTRDAESEQRLRDAVALVKEAQSTAREMSHLLRPRILDDFGLDAGLRELARGYSQRTGIAVSYHSLLRERLPALVETHLFRIAQEALTNISRHTLAPSAEIKLERGPEHLTLTISDRGGGMAPNQRTGQGLGLLGMHERAQAIGGTLKLRSVAGEGVTIRVTVPNPPVEAMPRNLVAGEAL